MTRTLELNTPAGNGVWISCRESFIGMAAGWFALQMIFMVMLVRDPDWIAVVAMASGMVCLFSWLVICWPATRLLRGGVLDGRIGLLRAAITGAGFGMILPVAGLLVGLIADGARGWDWGSLLGLLFPALAGAVAGWLIAWRAIREMRKDEFLKRHGFQ